LRFRAHFWPKNAGYLKKNRGFKNSKELKEFLVFGFEF
jgi:hypothetical protein